MRFRYVIDTYTDHDDMRKMASGIKNLTMKRAAYSICAAVIITALAYRFYNQGGEVLAYPGLMIHVLINGLILLSPTDDNYYAIPSGSYLIFNIIFYSLTTFAILLIAARRWK